MGADGRQIGQSSELAAPCAGLSPSESDGRGLFEFLDGSGLLQATHVDLVVELLPNGPQRSERGILEVVNGSV